MRDFACQAEPGRGAVQQHGRGRLGRRVAMFGSLAALLMLVLGAWLVWSGRQQTQLNMPTQPAAADARLPQPASASAQSPRPASANTSQQPGAQSAHSVPAARVSSMAARPVVPQSASQAAHQLAGVQPHLAQRNPPELAPVSEPYAFYQLLTRPLPERQPGDGSGWQSTRSYTIVSALLHSRKQVYKLRAQLLLQNFARVELSKENNNGSEWYRLEVKDIGSRSEMNRAHDFFADRGIDSALIASTN